jgi:hypothetical protein
MLLLQSLDGLFSVGRQFGLANRGRGTSEESRLPFCFIGFSLSSLGSLTILNLHLEISCKGVLFILNRTGDFVPEFSGLVGQLFLHWGNNLGFWEEWVKVNDKVFLLTRQHMYEYRTQKLTSAEENGPLPKE